MKEMSESHKGQEDDEIKEVDNGKTIQGIDRLKEQESEPKPQREAAEEDENSRKLGTETCGLQRIKRRHEERQENDDKDNNKKDEELRTHSEKDNGKNKRRTLTRTEKRGRSREE